MGAGTAFQTRMRRFVLDRVEDVRREHTRARSEPECINLTTVRTARRRPARSTPRAEARK